MPKFRFRLGPGAPEGATIDPIARRAGLGADSGTQGPGVYPIQVCVADLDHPGSTIECVEP